MFTDATGQPDYYLGDSLGLAVANGTPTPPGPTPATATRTSSSPSSRSSPPPAPPNDRFEPNNTPATATDLGTVIRTTLPKLAIAGGDEDWFRFQAAATGNLTVQANAGQPGIALTLELVDAGGATVLASGVDQLDDQGRRIGQQLDFPGVAGQTYLVHVMPLGNFGRPSPYSLDVQSLTADLGTRVQADAGGVVPRATRPTT